MFNSAGLYYVLWRSAAKAVAAKSIILSTLGVAVTAGVTALLCMGILHLPAAESFLIGAVLSSTDAASVFAILRKKKLNLKSGTASILEVESGSNDPIAYLLTIIAISMIGVGESIPLGATIVKQILFGVLMGIIQARITLTVLTKTKLIAEGLDTIFIIAVVMLCYGLTSAV